MARPAPARPSPAGPVVAVAPDGAYLVQRPEHVDVLGPDHGPKGRLPLRAAPDQAGARYAISTGARYAARVDRSGWIDLWDVGGARRAARLDPGAHLPAALETPWPAHRTRPPQAGDRPPSWGPTSS